MLAYGTTRIAIVCYRNIALMLPQVRLAVELVLLYDAEIGFGFSQMEPFEYTTLTLYWNNVPAVLNKSQLSTMT